MDSIHYYYFGNRSNPGAVLLLVRVANIALPEPDRFGGVMTIKVDKGPHHRIVTARVEPEVFNARFDLQLWTRESTTPPAMLIANGKGAAAPLLDLITDLTQTYAPLLTIHVADGLQPEQWQLVDYLSGLRLERAQIPGFAETMTLERLNAQVPHNDGQYVATLRDGTIALLGMLPELEQQLVGVQQLDGRRLMVPIAWIARVDNHPEGWWSPADQQFCACPENVRQYGSGWLQGWCRRCGYQIKPPTLRVKRSGGYV